MSAPVLFNILNWLRKSDKIQCSQRNTLHPCVHVLRMSCTTGELALSDELDTSLKL